MDYYGEVTIEDQFGWRRKVELHKPLVLIGSAPTTEVTLPEGHGGGVAPFHLQLICSGTSEESFRLFNISDVQVFVEDHVSGFEFPLLPGSSHLVGKEDELRIGEFKLRFKLLTSDAVANEQRTANIGMSLELPQVSIEAGDKLSGLISVRNYGARKRCQFEIDLEGLPDDCYEIAPAPLLYPGAEEKLLIRFFHRVTRPSAGPCDIYVRARASASYPTEQLLIHQVLYFEPVFEYELDIEDEVFEEAPAEKPLPAVSAKKQAVRLQAENPEVEEIPLPPKAVAAARMPRQLRQYPQAVRSVQPEAGSEKVYTAEPVRNKAKSKEPVVQKEPLSVPPPFISIKAEPEKEEAPLAEVKPLEKALKEEPIAQDKEPVAEVRETPPVLEEETASWDEDESRDDSWPEVEESGDTEEMQDDGWPEMEETEDEEEPQDDDWPEMEITGDSDEAGDEDWPEVEETEDEDEPQDEDWPEMEESGDVEEPQDNGWPDVQETENEDEFQDDDWPEEEKTDEDAWWDEADALMNSREPSGGRNRFTRNVRSRLTRDEIQVIRAGQDSDEEDG